MGVIITIAGKAKFNIAFAIDSFWTSEIAITHNVIDQILSPNSKSSQM